jgi:hypothetical protein
MFFSWNPLTKTFSERIRLKINMLQPDIFSGKSREKINTSTLHPP